MSKEKLCTCVENTTLSANLCGCHDGKGPVIFKKAVVVLIVNEADHTILTVSRKDDPDACGLPGGKVDEGESMLAAAEREFKEETGVELPRGACRFYFRDMCEGYDTQTILCELSSSGIERLQDDINNASRDPSETGSVCWSTQECLVDGPFGEYNKKLFDFASHHALRSIVQMHEDRVNADKEVAKYVATQIQYELSLGEDANFVHVGEGGRDRTPEMKVQIKGAMARLSAELEERS